MGDIEARLGAAQLVAAMSETLAGQQAALISPFAPQADLLAALTHGRIVGSTVHRFQGSEADIVVFDTVESDGTHLEMTDWFAEGHTDTEGARLVNVAVSRAREQLIVLANLGHVGRGTTAVSTFIANTARGGHRLSWRDLVSPGAATRTEDSGIESLAAALGSTSEPAELFFPDASGSQLAHLLRRIGSRRFKESTIWLPARSARSDAGATLMMAGAFVRPLAPIRESVAVVGDTVISSSDSLLLPVSRRVLVTHTNHSPRQPCDWFADPLSGIRQAVGKRLRFAVIASG